MSDDIFRMLEEQERMRRLLDQINSPLQQVNQLTAMLPQRQLDHLMGVIPQRQIDELAGAFTQRQIDQLLGPKVPHFLNDASTRLGIGAEVMRYMEREEQQRKLLYGAIGGLHGAELRGLADGTVMAREAYERMFRLPALDEVSRLAREAMEAGALASGAAQAPGSIAALEATMREMRNPWVSVGHVDRSAIAFAELQALGGILRDHSPFDATAVASVRSSLGDWRDPITQGSDLFVDPMLRSGFYIERGFNPSLTDFTISAFEESLDIAGLRVRVPEDADEVQEDVRARAAFTNLRKFEIAVRRFIEKVMHAAYGNDWMKHQLPPGMLDRWRDKRATAVKAGEVELSLIDYADFTDYKQIIDREDNWKTVYKPIFGRREDVRESFQRLFPLRIATYHARIVTLDDELLLTVETKRVITAIQKAGVA